MKMKPKLLFLMSLMVLLCSAGSAKKVHTLGDSTMAPYDESATVTRGWGMYFGNFLTNGWTSVNYAKGGRDSRGGYNELWQNAKNNVEAGDYVIIQFAHNDEKIGGMDRDEVYNYYISQGMTTEAAALDTRGTTPSTTYKQWLGKIVDEVVAKGATPVLVGPVCRSYFSSDGKIRRNGRHDLGDSFSKLTTTGITTGNSVPASDHLMDYPYHMQQLAVEKGIAYIDLTTATKDLYESYGDAKCHEQLFDGDGSTHFNTTGALLVARLCAQLLKEQNILADDIVVPTDLSVSPAMADLGDGYKGQTAVKELTLNGFGLEPADGTISITATEGITLSTDKANWNNTLAIDYKNGTLVQNFYARVILTNAGTFSGTITVSSGGKTVEVPLTVNIIELGGGNPFTVTWPLTANDDATVTGDAVAGNVTLSKLTKYGNNADYGLLAYVEGGWTAAEDDDPERYVCLSVKAPEGRTLDINQISMKVGARGGNGMKCHVYYSTDGFKTRSTIWAPTSMTSNTMNDVEAQPVVSLDEGEELQIRVYPWYTGNATGKYICISDVSVGGQSKDLGGLNLTGSITYKLDKGGVEQGDDGVMEPTEMSAGFAGKKFTAGSSLTMNGTITYTGANNEKTVMTKIYNGTGSSFPSAATDANTLTLTLTPEDGYYFMPTAVSFEGARFGTDGGTLTVSVETGDKKEELCAAAPVNRSDKNLDIARFNYQLTNLMATADAPLKLNFSFIGLGNTKSMGLANLVINGTLTGAASQTVKYALNTMVVPALAGTITRDPDLSTYKEGSEVTLTAVRNFGYRFKEWQDASGATVSTTAETTITMDGEKTMKAVFEQVPVYTVTTRVTNDADRPLGSVTLTPDEHQGRYEAGTEITAVAKESKILKFMQWTDENENAGTTASRKVTVNSDMELVAHYEVQDFVAVFDASKVQSYAYTTTAVYPFAADVTWDEQRHATAAVVKVGDGSLAYTKDGGTPVVRNREGVVLSGINGLYQNGYRTTDIAFQYQFSTKGFTDVRMEGVMAAKNMASKNWKALYSTDGVNFTQIDGAQWEMTANVSHDVSISLPAAANGQEQVYVRITGDGDDMLSTAYPFDQQFDGLDYCSHSESGVGNLYVLGTAEVEADNEAPVVTGTLPANQATGISATGRITISYNERIQNAGSNEPATLNGEPLSPQWSSRSVSFDYFNLTYGETYTFQLPDGYVEDRSGNKGGAVTLVFTVMERQQPVARTFDAIVDGSLTVDVAATDVLPAQYRRIQDAIDAVPTSNDRPWLIFIKEGYYNDPNTSFNGGYGFRYTNPSDANDNTTEQISGGQTQYDECRLIHVNKPNIHLIGQATDKVTIAGDRLDGACADRTRPWYHVNAGATMEIQAGAKDFYMENVTVDNENWTKKQMAGPQALAMNISADRTVINNCNVRSYQDTYYSSGTHNRQLWHKSTIEGAVDFIYGDGDVYFESCRLNINREKGGYIVAPSHVAANTRWGYVFNNTTITTDYAGDPSTYQIYFGRPWHNQPITVFLHTQCEVGTYDGYWYETMGGLPALWAVYDIWDKNGNKMSETSRSEYWMWNEGKTEKITGMAKNFLTDEEAATYTIANVFAGDKTSNAETGVWNPLPIIEKTAAPVPVAGDGEVSWEAVPYAICYVVTVNGKVVAFPTANSIQNLKTGDVVTVQAVNEHGALSDMSQSVTVSTATGITTLNVDCNATLGSVQERGTVIATPHLAPSKNGEVFDLQGRRLPAFRRGMNVVRLSDGSVRKIFVE